ncbi:ABC transporter permease [Simiduia curdlanivorans]|uniref:Transport permease protein n=1 Tax=Simiduia curdlanivorans TaxID=1492769 RepID=A0ABV8V909_9GAMM|nr:ABC transporter permease [Simiduia curdlanivorans]MDN3638999.1 ABC transporter permease [Simiduia curdlanivorans]
MKRLFALFMARNKEYYRDKSSLIWSFVMPPLIIGLVALAFNNGGQKLFKVGVLDSETAVTLFDPAFTRFVPVTELDYGQQRIAHHQLDLLVDQTTQQYWLNPSSEKGRVLEALIAQKGNWQRQEISGQAVRYVDWVVPGILGMNLMFSGLWGIGYVIVRYRKNGVLKRLQATPVHPVEFIGAQIASRMIIMLMVSSIVYLSCDLFLDFLMLGSYWDLLLIAILGNLSVLSLGLLVAARSASEEFANGLLNFVSFPMLMVSEVWFSLDGAPAWLNAIANLSPLTHMVKAARAVMVDGASLGQVSDHLAALVLITTLLIGLSAWLFRWQEK